MYSAITRRAVRSAGLTPLGRRFAHKVCMCNPKDLAPDILLPEADLPSCLLPGLIFAVRSRRTFFH